MDSDSNRAVCPVTQKPGCPAAGFFISQSDWLAGKASFVACLKQPGNRMGHPSPFAMRTIRLITPDGEFIFHPGDIYGYFCNGKLYQFFGGEYYTVRKIISNQILYSAQLQDEPGKAPGVYYYSRNWTSPLHKLSRRNIRKEFSNLNLEQNHFKTRHN
ncbi:hypothetical protein [Adhaeribacter rhizoryzae]|nr:hypothetical protein [Adhaeribacter rhizoryzae]